MRVLNLQATIPTNVQNTPTGQLALRLTQQQMEREIRDAARGQILVQHHGPTAQIIGSDATITTRAYVVDQDDMRYMHAIAEAVQDDDDQSILKAARELVQHMNGTDEPATPQPQEA